MGAPSNIDSFFEFGKIVALKGLNYGGEHSVTCCNCNKELFRIMKISDKPTIMNMGVYGKIAVPVQYFVSNCPFCNNTSWKIEVEGQCMIKGSDGKTIIADISIDLWNNEKVINTLEIMKDASRDDGE